ncbi:MAG: DUF1285 domain-containing protein [Alphaproteobacteria bacterium]
MVKSEKETRRDRAFVKSVINCGDLDMRIAVDGTWFHQGTPIGRKELVKLFASVLHREDDGSYWLETPVERGEITVDDAAFIAFRTDQVEDNWQFRTNIDEVILLGPDHPLRVEVDEKTGEPRPYIYVKNGLEARLSRNVYYELVHAAVQQTDGRWTIRSGGVDWTVGWA